MIIVLAYYVRHHNGAIKVVLSDITIIHETRTDDAVAALAIDKVGPT